MRNLILPALLLWVAGLITAPSAVFAAGDAEAGEIAAYTCGGCHGVPGYNNIYPTYKVPKIGGQNFEYLVLALNAYRNGERDHPTMKVQAQALTDKEIEDIATYLSSLGDE